MMAMRTDWQCERCGKRGTLWHEATDDVMAVLRQLREAHARKSPRCAFDAWAVRASLGVQGAERPAPRG